MIVPASSSYSSVLVSKLIPTGSALNKASEIDTNSATYSHLRRLFASRCSEGLMRRTIARHGSRLRANQLGHLGPPTQFSDSGDRPTTWAGKSTWPAGIVG